MTLLWQDPLLPLFKTYSVLSSTSSSPTFFLPSRYNQGTKMKQPNIVTFGGTGSVIIKSLIEAGFTNIKAISATDSVARLVLSAPMTGPCAVDLLRNLRSDSNHRHQTTTTFTDLFSYTDGLQPQSGLHHLCL